VTKSILEFEERFPASVDPIRQLCGVILFQSKLAAKVAFSARLLQNCDWKTVAKYLFELVCRRIRQDLGLAHMELQSVLF
jgi:hypothetical protein